MSTDYDPKSNAALPGQLDAKRLEGVSLDEMREHFESARKRLAERDERERRGREERDETCMRCGTVIPHGGAFVPVVRNVTRRTLANPDFIGRQPVYVHVEHGHFGALCLACVLPPETKP